jgi:hypothetical protein
MDCLSEIAGGVKMTDVLNTKTLLEWIAGFVDDTSLLSNSQLNKICSKETRDI